MCLHCHGDLDADQTFFELYRQPSGDLYRLCSLDCLKAFVIGGES